MEPPTRYSGLSCRMGRMGMDSKACWTYAKEHTQRTGVGRHEIRRTRTAAVYAREGTGV